MLEQDVPRPTEPLDVTGPRGGERNQAPEAKRSMGPLAEPTSVAILAIDGEAPERSVETEIPSL